MTAMTRTSMVWESEIEPGEIRVFHQTERIPARPATRRAEAEGNRAQERDVVAERAHPRRVVTHPLEREAQRRSGDVAQRHVDDGRDDERDVEEARRLLQRVPDDRGELDVVHAPEPRELRHLREEEVDQHRERERDHEEVDSVAPARDRSQKEADRHRRAKSQQRRQPWVQSDLGAAVCHHEVRRP